MRFRTPIGVVALMLAGDPFMIERWRWLRTRIRRGGLRTLDAGCGSGAFAIYAASRGNEVLGISFEEQANVKGRRRAQMFGLGESVDFRTGDLRLLDEIAPEIGTFDQIICFETIEHIADDGKLVRDLASVLRPGGRLLLCTPSDVHRPLALEVVSGVEDGNHVRFGYSHRDLRRLVMAAGLEVEEESWIGGVVSRWAWNVMGFLAMRTPVPDKVMWVLTYPLRLLQLIDRPLTALLRHPFVSVAIVARSNQPAGTSQSFSSR
jgi:SAM-dependent methyltransferase